MYQKASRPVSTGEEEVPFLPPPSSERSLERNDVPHEVKGDESRTDSNYTHLRPPEERGNNKPDFPKISLSLFRVGSRYDQNESRARTRSR